MRIALEIHKLSFWALIGLVVLHAGAAFHHHLINGTPPWQGDAATQLVLVEIAGKE